MTPAKQWNEKVWAMTTVLRGEASASAVAEQLGVSEQTISSWRKMFIEAGVAALEPADTRVVLEREAAQAEEIRTLAAALRLAELELSVWRINAEIHVPFETLEELRVGAGVTVPRFTKLLGVSRRVYLDKLRAAAHATPAPVDEPVGVASEVGGPADEDRALVAKCSAVWPAFGPRQIWALLQAEGQDISEDRVEAAMDRDVAVSV